MIRWPEDEIGRNSVKPWTIPSRRASKFDIGAALYAPGACDRFPAVKRVAASLLSFLALMLFAAPAALADNGVGLAGPTTDKTVTFFCFGVIGFFVVLVIVMSLIQGHFDKRKEERKNTLKRLS